MSGIENIEIYFPKTYVDQTEYEKYKHVPSGKFTKGLGQEGLSFTYPFEDINSICLTVVHNLLRNNNIHPSQIGRLEVGTETLVDKSKSTKTILMKLFQGYHDIEGATSINACYGGTNALLNTLNWISSPSWDGRYGIVVLGDLAVYEDGPARPTGGAGAIALLIGPKGKITFHKQRASFMDNEWDFYKPNPNSEYPTVDGKVSIDCYLNAIEQCYMTLKKKHQNREDFLQAVKYYCFHAPFNKMVQKSFTKLLKTENPKITEEQIVNRFKQQVLPSTQIPKKCGNMYTGSLYAGLISLLMNQSQNIVNKNVLMFSYGSGLCSTMFTIHVRQNPLKKQQIQQIRYKLSNRIKISPQIYTKVMLERQKNYGNLKGIQIQLINQLIDDNVYYLKEIDTKWRRFYQIKNPSPIKINKNQITAMQRLKNLNKHMNMNHNKDIKQSFNEVSKFYKLSISDRIQFLSKKLQRNIDHATLQSGGLDMETADSMIQNVVGTLSLPLSVVPNFPLNHKKVTIPMSIQEPSVVAAVNSIGKFISSVKQNEQATIFTSSTPNIMIGQIHLPNCQPSQIHKILSQKNNIIKKLNQLSPSMVKRGGGINDLRIRQLTNQINQGQFTANNNSNHKHYVVDVYINVCEAMGANLTNTIAEKTKEIIQKMGISTGIAILSNYCIERRALAWFEVNIKDMGWKGVAGEKVVQKILEAYHFATLDKHRATTHNKGIMNGIDAVCLATGQDWRAVESAAHSYACRNGGYSPLTHYQIVNKNEKVYFRGCLELPIAVGTKGGVIQRNPLYKMNMQILDNPTAQQLSQVLVAVGLAQNLAALRALAIQGIQKGHMILHSRTIAQKAGVPKHLIEEACKYMAFRKKYDIETAQAFLQMQTKAKL